MYIQGLNLAMGTKQIIEPCSVYKLGLIRFLCDRKFVPRRITRINPLHRDARWFYAVYAAFRLKSSLSYFLHFFIFNDDQFEFRIGHACGLTHKLLIAYEEAPIICETYNVSLTSMKCCLTHRGKYL